uniref:(California timema) hypothetical protein n=1 Tax=Timema californicum TaxID=61474 RepID=A0A7R9JD17_TIMCA|nr:unnamed protein product [Timema californicum]
MSPLVCPQNHSSNNNNSNNNRSPSNNVNLSGKVLRWGSDASQRVVGSATTQQQHQTLTRRNSQPASISSLVSSVSSLLLVNIQEEAAAAGGAQHRRLDRSQSEPARANNVNTSRYKTELCRPYEESGACKYGDKCQFAHGVHELRNLARHPKYKTELCRTFHTIGFCPYGPRCHFIHNADEARGKSASPPPPGGARPKPLSLGFGSSGDSPSPASSLSQSPTTSVGSFFSSSDPDVYAVLSASSSPANTAFSYGGQDTLVLGSPPPSPAASLSPRESPTPDARLPVFNRLSKNIMMGLADLIA